MHDESTRIIRRNPTSASDGQRRIPWGAIGTTLAVLVAAVSLIGWGYSAETRLCIQEAQTIDHETRIRAVEAESAEARQWRREKDRRDERVERKLDRVLGIAP